MTDPLLFCFIQERDKFYLSRSVVLELLQALKFKSPLPDTNLLLLVQVDLLCICKPSRDVVCVGERLQRPGACA